MEYLFFYDDDDDDDVVLWCRFKCSSLWVLECDWCLGEQSVATLALC